MSLVSVFRRSLEFTGLIVKEVCKRGDEVGRGSGVIFRVFFFGINFIERCCVRLGFWG